MQRLVLAIILVAALVVALTLIVGGLRRVLMGDGETLPAAQDGDGLRLAAYVLLLGVIGYVSFAGSG